MVEDIIVKFREGPLMVKYILALHEAVHISKAFRSGPSLEELNGIKEHILRLFNTKPVFEFVPRYQWAIWDGLEGVTSQTYEFRCSFWATTSLKEKQNRLLEIQNSPLVEWVKDYGKSKIN